MCYSKPELRDQFEKVVIMGNHLVSRSSSWFLISCLVIMRARAILWEAFLKVASELGDGSDFLSIGRPLCWGF